MLFDQHLARLGIQLRDFGHHHVVALLVKRIVLGLDHAIFAQHLARRHHIHLPKVRGMGLGQAHQGSGHTVFFTAHNRPLTLHGDVGQDIHHLLGGTGAALDLLALDRKPLPRSQARHAIALLLAHERHVVRERLCPPVHHVLALQPVFHKRVARTGNDGIHLGRRLLQQLQAHGRIRPQHRIGFSIGHA